jgi:hypothetical protein
MRIPGFPAFSAATFPVTIIFPLVVALWSAPAHAQPAAPFVAQGPLPVSAASYPFGGAGQTQVPTDLARDGYVEEEFLFSGTANIYDWPQAGPAVVRTVNAPYTTRVLVRRPADRARFSGTVIVEMLNPSNLFDLNIGWALSHKEFVRQGHAWVGITAKPVAIETLKAFNPSRYASLAWANPLPLDDPRNCTTVARDTQRTTENGLVWDVHRHVAQWLRGRANNPLASGSGAGTHPVRRLYAWGYSQTGGFLYTYVNAIHPLDVHAFGKPLFDAFFIAVASGPSPINQCASPMAPEDPRRRITDPGVPVVRVMSQSDYLRTMAARLADGDLAPNQLRNYEIAGSGHATPDELTFAAKPEDIEKAGRAVPPMACNEGPRSRFPSGLAFNAILRNLDAWVRAGTAPPRAEPIQVVDGKPVLDRFGNVVGGVRSPLVDVPTSTWMGNSTGESFCGIAGHELPFDAARMRELYPNPDSYARAFGASVEALVKARFITPEDGKDLVALVRR